MLTAQNAVRFFYENAGYSWNPRTESQAQGKLRCALHLAKAEMIALNQGYSFEWSVDDCDSSEWDTSGESPYAQWVCVCRDSEGVVVSSLGGIDFGRGNTPWGNSYRRVVEAELALEVVEF